MRRIQPAEFRRLLQLLPAKSAAAWAAVWLLLCLSCGRSTLEEARRLGGRKGDRVRAEALAKGAFVVHTKNKDYARAERLWLETAAADPSWWKPYYQLACIHALTGRKLEAIELLRLALKVEKSPQMISWMRSDSDLTALRQMPEFGTLLSSGEGERPVALPAALVGNWTGATTAWIGLLPAPYNTYRPVEYQSLAISGDGQFRISGTSGRMLGTWSGNGSEASFSLSESEEEVRVVGGNKTGGKRSINRKSTFRYSLQKVAHEGKTVELLCVEWTDEDYASPTGGKRECYSREQG